MLGLMGDTADNIPGIPGVGDKTARELLKQYDNVENVIANADNLKGALQRKVKEGAESAIISKKLATIWLDAPVPFVVSDLVVEPVNKEAIKTIFNELEFRQLTKSAVLGEELPPATASSQGNLFDAPIEASANKANDESEMCPN